MKTRFLDIFVGKGKIGFEDIFVRDGLDPAITAAYPIENAKRRCHLSLSEARYRARFIAYRIPAHRI